MRRSRRPGAARSRRAGTRNEARQWPRPHRTSADAPHPGCAHEPRPGPAAEPGLRGAGAARSRGAANCRTRSPGSRTALRAGPYLPADSPAGASRYPGRSASHFEERDNALSGADHRAGDAGSRARNAGQETARARKAAGSARAELDRARQDPGRQAQVREDPAPDQARPPAAPGAQIAAAKNARARPQARTRHAEAEPQRARADCDQTAGQASPGQPTSPTRPPRSPGNLATSNYQRSTSRSGRSPLRSTTMPQPFRSAVTCAHRSWRITVFVLLGDRARPAVRGRRTPHRRRAGGRCECTGTAPPGYRSPSRRLPVSADHRGGGKGRAPRRGQWPGHRAAHRQ